MTNEDLLGLPVGEELVESLSTYFDLLFYNATYMFDFASVSSAMNHYMDIGWKLGYDPSPAFSSREYLLINGDVADSEMNPLIHFVFYGVNEGRSLRAFDNQEVVREASTDSNAFVAQLESESIYNLSHSPAPEKILVPGVMLERLKAVVNPVFYMESHHARMSGSIDPVEHFFTVGFYQNLDPNPFVYTKFIKGIDRDIGNSIDGFLSLVERGTIMNPLMKSPISFSDLMSRLIDRKDFLKDVFLVDLSQYAAFYPDIASSQSLHPIEHLFWYGLKENRLRFCNILDTALLNVADDVNDSAFLKSRDRPLDYANVSTLPLPAIRRNLTKGVSLHIGSVLFKNDLSEISKLLNSIQLNLSPETFTVKVSLWDNSPDALDLSSVFASLTYEPALTHDGNNCGFARGQNALMREAFSGGADYYLGLNPDGYLLGHALTEALLFAQELRAPALIELKNEPLCHPKWYDPLTGETDWVSGASFLVAKEVFLASGGFDDEFPLYCEDVDFSFTVRAKGFRTYVASKALFYHDTTPRMRELNQARSNAMLLGAWYLSEKWGCLDKADRLRLELMRRGMGLRDFKAEKRVRNVPDSIRQSMRLDRFAPSRFWN
ncbi:GT2 family glycosyltransferase [Rhizobium sp. PP-CC-3A-592]|nr:GT2 family glycosyltransferase [Rhizobium sp. PP-CC-3A-592]